MIPRYRLAPFAFVLLCLSSSGPAAPAAAAQESPKVGAAAGTVRLDFVVRDKHDEPIADLRAAEVTLREDGAPQSITDLRRVTLEAAGSSAAAPAGPTRFVAFVFPRLTAVERDLAQTAAEEFVKKQLVPGVAVAVLRIGQGLEVVQDYTSDPRLLKTAVKQALDSKAEAGDATVSALLSVVQWIKDRPNRKTVLLFASGIVVPDGFEHVLQALVGIANRYGISFYGIDPSGVPLSQGGMDASRLSSGINTGGNRRSQVGTELGGGQVRLSMHLDSGSPMPLGQLAHGTGGFVSPRSNSFGKPMRQIGEDLRDYYELTYTPTAAHVAGRASQLDLRVAREGTQLQGPASYLLGGMLAQPEREFEKPLVAALASASPPQDVELWARAFHFDWDGEKLSQEIRVNVPLAKVTLLKEEGTGAYRGSVAILARVKGASGEVVDKFARRFPLAVPAEQLERARASNLPFSYRLALAPGAYTLEVAVRDEAGDKLGTRREPLAVRAPQGLTLSSVVLGTLVPAAPGSEADDPFRYQGTVLSPNLGEPIKIAAGAATLWFAVYPAPGSSEPVQAVFTLSSAGDVLMNAPAQLPGPEAGGRISFGSTIQVGQLPAGSYEMKVAVSQGGSHAEETLGFTMVQ